ncbi:hypothetical protein Tco_0878397 [Tanacetum coccineum]|uniref:NYN domain-containing protein n=1 Tax=Tanacetum coccineum TaxID=301880 RepID=A0ABQ5BY76_9ASTR
MLLSGDDDFCSAFDSLDQLGFTTLLVFLVEGASHRPRRLSRYTFLWEKLSDGKGLMSPLGKLLNEAPKLRASPKLKKVLKLKATPKLIKAPKSKAVRELQENRVASAIYWDMDTCKLPETVPVHPDYANEYINDKLEHDPKIAAVDLLEYKVYGKEENLPTTNLRVAGYEFITTLSTKHMKHLHIENMIELI